MVYRYSDFTNKLLQKRFVVLTKRSHGPFALCVIRKFVQKLQTAHRTVAVNVWNRHANH